MEGTMADFDYDALSDLTLTLEAEDGSEVNLEMLYIFEYDDVDYAAFTEQDNPEPVIYFFTLTIGEPTEGEEEAEITFECVEDETLGNELLAIFQELADAEAEEGDGIEIETEDDDDEEAEDEDDSKWDQFIHKKLDD